MSHKLNNLPIQYDWWTDYKKTIKKCQHKIYFGQTTFGKTYHALWKQEIEIDKGITKVFSIWNNRFPAELEAMIYPSKESKLKFGKKKPHGYEIAVYVPLTDNLPKKLPKHYLPFTISAKKISEIGLKCIYGRKDISTFSSIYQQVKREMSGNDSFVDLLQKLYERKETSKAGETAIGFGGIDLPVFTEAQYTTYSSFLSRISAFRSSGIISSDNFPLTIDNYLKKELLDSNQKRYVILNTHFIDSFNLKAFVTMEFIEAIRRINSKIRKKYNKIILYINEAGDLFPPPSSSRFLPIHNALIDYGIEVITRIRHEDIELNIDVQSPDNLHPEIRGQGLIVLTHRIKDPKQLNQYIKETDSELDKEDLALIQKFPRGAFHELGFPLVVFRDALKRTQAGYRLPRPRLARHVKLSLKEFDKFPKYSTSVFKDLLLTEWKQSNKRFKKAKKDIIHRNTITKMTKSELRIDKVIRWLSNQPSKSFYYKDIAKGTKLPVQLIPKIIDEVEVKEGLGFSIDREKDGRKAVVILTNEKKDIELRSKDKKDIESEEINKVKELIDEDKVDKDALNEFINDLKKNELSNEVKDMEDDFKKIDKEYTKY